MLLIFIFTLTLSACGTNGIDGINGVDGANGVDGINGVDGKDCTIDLSDSVRTSVSIESGYLVTVTSYFDDVGELIKYQRDESSLDSDYSSTRIWEFDGDDYSEFKINNSTGFYELTTSIKDILTNGNISKIRTTNKFNPADELIEIYYRFELLTSEMESIEFSSYRLSIDQQSSYTIYYDWFDIIDESTVFNRNGSYEVSITSGTIPINNNEILVSQLAVELFDLDILIGDIIIGENESEYIVVGLFEYQ